ncbi:MAG: SPOR domain-containing protein [Bacteroidota bacterium]
MIRSFFLIFVLVLVFAMTGKTQSGDERNYIDQSPQLDTILEAYRKINKKQGIQGYRIQIYTDSGNQSKLRTDRMKSQFDARFPEVRSYISYDEPYYKLRVGDFRTRLDAERFLRRIAPVYLSSILVVDRINYPRLDDSYGNPVEIIPEETE